MVRLFALQGRQLARCDPPSGAWVPSHGQFQSAAVRRSGFGFAPGPRPADPDAADSNSQSFGRNRAGQPFPPRCCQHKTAVVVTGTLVSQVAQLRAIVAFAGYLPERISQGIFRELNGMYNQVA